MTIYRRIYQQHHGPIPKDNEGRTYDIHHIDGNRKNNHPSNLKAVSIQEHYDIHYSQGDWAACVRIAAKQKIPHTTLSYLVKQQQTERVRNGTHHFLDSEFQKKLSLRCLEKGLHTSQIKKSCSYCGKECSLNTIGRHEKTCEKNPNRQKMDYKLVTCPHCGVTGKSNAMYRWHFDKCKDKK